MTKTSRYKPTNKFNLLKIIFLFVFMVGAAHGQTDKSGSGFFINSQGYLVTNFHVIKDGKTFEVIDNDRKHYEAKVISYDVANDLAILRAETKPNRFITISRSNNVKKGDRVFALGFPNTGMQGDSIKFTDGTISSISGIADQPNEFQISVPIQPGNSGSPLLDANGSLVGIVVSKLSVNAAIKQTGTLPENVNYAVKSNYLVELLRASRIDFVQASTRPLSNGPLSAAAESIENAVVMVISGYSNTIDNGINAIRPLPSPPTSVKPKAPEVKEVVLPPKLPRSSEAIGWNAKSIESANSENWVEAIRTSTIAINIDSDYGEAYVNRCRAYIGYGNLEAAHKDCVAALMIDPSNLVAKNNLGVIELRKSNANGAISIYESVCLSGFELSCENFRKLRGYSPANPEEFAKLKIIEANKSFSQKDWSSVVIQTTEIIRVAPNFTDAYISRSGAYANLGKLDDSLADVNRAIRLSPNDANAYNNLGYVLELKKEKSQAILQYEIGCSLKSEISCSNLKRLKQL